MRVRENAYAEPRNHALLHKLRDSAFRANGPTFAGRCESDAVVILSVKQTTSGAVVERNMRAGCAHGNPTIFRPGDRGTKGKSLVEENPSLAAIGRERRRGADLIGFAIIAADDHAVPLFTEGN